MTSPAPVSTRDLAAQLGLSHNTVARALRNLPHVAASTRDRVLKAAEAAGYRASPLVTALMTQVRQHHRVKPTGEVIAYLTSAPTENGWRELPSHVQQFEGASRRADELGFTLQHFWLGPRGNQSGRVSRILNARGVRGSLLAPRPNPDDDTLELDWQSHTTVIIGLSMPHIHVHRAVHDSISQMSDCYARLCANGRRRIGLALHRRHITPHRSRWITAFLGARWQHDGANIPPLLFDDEVDASAFHRWFDRQKSDAIIGIWPDQPLSWLRARRVTIPRDVAYATLDLFERPGMPAGIRQNNRGLGMAAIDILASQIFRNETGIPHTPFTINVDGIWSDGPTVSDNAKTPPPPRRRADERPRKA